MNLLPTCTSTFHLDHDGYVGQIRAKDWPKAGPNGEFRVYAIHGDVTRPEALKEAIFQLLRDHGIGRRRVVINF